MALGGPQAWMPLGIFNIGGPEMLIVFLVALLVFGPNKLPEIMRNVGKAVNTFKAETRKAQEMLRTGLDEVNPGTKGADGPGVVDTPDGHTPAPPVLVPPDTVQPAPEAPARPAPPPPPEHEVRPVVREYEDT